MNETHKGYNKRSENSIYIIKSDIYLLNDRKFNKIFLFYIIYYHFNLQTTSSGSEVVQ